MRAIRSLLTLFAASAVLLGVFVWTENEIAPSFQACKSENASEQSAEKADDNTYAIPKFIIIREVTCSLRLIERHNALVAAIAAIAVAGFTLALWQSTNLLWRTSQKQTAHLEETAKRELRAYVHVAGAKVNYGRTQADRYVVVAIKNYGQTPTFELSFLMGIDVRERPLKTILADPPSDTRKGIEDLPPARESLQRLPIGPFTLWGEYDLRTGQAGIYAWGIITYKDLYGDPHTTKIRYVCAEDGIRNGLMSPCEAGNSST